VAAASVVYEAIKLVMPGNDDGEGGMRAALIAIVFGACIGCSLPVRAADIAAGKEKAALCVGCHGEGGISQMDNIPSLAAQPDQFIQWQLVFFRAGTRQNEQMQPIVEQLTNEDIRNLGAYYASLPPPKPKPDDDPDLSKKGEQAAAGRRCAACHTDSYAGTKAVARVAGQREEYLVKALRDYKSGVRSGGAMAAMADVAFPLSEEEIEALAHYLAHL
jgi:cytochrome c553